MKLLFAVNAHRYSARHRLPVLKSACKSGWSIVSLTPRASDAEKELQQAGFECISLCLSRRGLNPLAEIVAIAKLIKIYRQEKPDAVYHATIKPVIYGTIAARLSNTKAIVNAITGLGYVYASESLLARILRPVVNTLYRFALGSKNTHTIFQNHDDSRTLRNIVGMPSDSVSIIPGSGVDPDVFQADTEPQDSTTVTMVSRLILEKGVMEYAQAAREVRQAKPEVRFLLVGGTDTESTSGIDQSLVQRWVSDRILDWWGERSDMVNVYNQSSIVVLPSYYGEGIPKVLIEAASCGRPVVTTDHPGCREAVIHGETGILVPPKDPAALAEAIQTLVADPELRARMGAAGRRRVEKDMSTKVVVERTADIFAKLLPDAPRLSWE